MIMTDDHKVRRDKCHRASDNQGLHCQEGSLTHKSQLSSSLDEQRKGDYK